MRVVVTGATGNVGTSVLAALGAEPEVREIVGVARRVPDGEPPKVRWAAADVSRDDLVRHFRGADAVVHLAWAIQPSHDPDLLYAINVRGTAQVVDAVARAKVGTLVYASSVGAYSPGSKTEPVGETWPTHGVPSSFYSRHKAATERLLDDFEHDHPGVRVVRLRKALIFKREAGAEIRRLWLGPFVPGPLLHPAFVPVVPDDRLTFQVVHTHDVAEAYRLALLGDARGAFNIATDPIVTPAELGRILRARPVRVRPALLRAMLDASWRARVQPTPPGWVDLGLAVPVMSSARAREELGWRPRHDAAATVLDLLGGMRTGAGLPTPAMAPWRDPLAATPLLGVATEGHTSSPPRERIAVS
jgi:nucleoside-diphosphate-sugar epimerase